MKTLFTSTQNIKKSLVFSGLILLTLFMSNNTFAQVENGNKASQGITVKGIVTNGEEALSGANIILKGSTTGTSSDKNGAFTFPKTLYPNDVLVFNYLGYETQEVVIKGDTPFIKVILYSDTVEIMGALPVDKPYKSKRKKSK